MAYNQKKTVDEVQSWNKSVKDLETGFKSLNSWFKGGSTFLDDANVDAMKALVRKMDGAEVLTVSHGGRSRKKSATIPTTLFSKLVDELAGHHVALDFKNLKVGEIDTSGFDSPKMDDGTPQTKRDISSLNLG